MHPVDPVLVTGYVALFVAIGGAFLAVNLLVGWLVRPRAPNVEKLEVYECGEPTIGSSFVQFDLRFYVVALLFIIFDVEVALFFPWATVFGKATQLDDPALASVQADGTLTPAAAGLFRELGVRQPTVPAAGPFRELVGVRGAVAATGDDAATTHDEAWHATRATAWAQARARSVGRAEPQGAQAVGEWSVATTGALLARTALVDMAAFFAVLLVGFAYVWYRGDLDWVRAVSTERAAPVR